jgi:hypothetical protein
VEDKTPRPPPGLRQLASILRQVRPPDPEVEAARAELDAKKPIPIPGEAQEVA